MKNRFLARLDALRMRRPFVVGTVVGSVPLGGQLTRAHAAGVDAIEIRLDTFPFVLDDPAEAARRGGELLRVVRRLQKPILLTLRAPSESGASTRAAHHAALTDARRVAGLAALLPLADAIDVEIRRGAFAKEMTRRAREAGLAVMHSLHDFRGPGQQGALRMGARRSRQFGGDLFKVAVTPRSEGELSGFLAWGGALPNRRKVLIGMGAIGAPSRVLGFCFGSCLTYGHLGRGAAPGQMPAALLARHVRALFGR